MVISMFFFKEVKGRTLARADMLASDNNKSYYMSEISVDGNGEFISGIESVEDTDSEITSMLYSHAYRKNIENSGSIAEIKKATEDYIINAIHDDMCRENIRHFMDKTLTDSGNFEELKSSFIRILLNYIESIRNIELEKLLWSGMYKFTVSAVPYADRDQKVIEYASSLDSKVSIEHRYINSESSMWWNRELSKFRIMNCNTNWLYIKDCCESVGKFLQTSIVTEEDFHENPIHYMMGRCYNPGIITERIGTELVEVLIGLGFMFRDNRYYGILQEMNKVLCMMYEPSKIVDDTIRNNVKFVLNLLSANQKFIKDYINLFDYYMYNHIMSFPDGGAMED